MLDAHDMRVVFNMRHTDKYGNVKTHKNSKTQMGKSTITFTLKDKNDNIKNVVTKPFRTFTSNMLTYLYSIFMNDTNGTYKVTTLDGVDRAVRDYQNYYVNSKIFDTTASKDINTGIVIGSGNRVFNVHDFDLDQQINDPLVIKNNDTKNDPEYDSVNGVSKFSFSTEFINNTGGPIDVKEVGLTYIVELYNSGTSTLEDTGERVIVARDILPAPITFNISDKLVVEYTLNYQDENTGFSINFLNMLYAAMMVNNDQNVIKTDGTTITFSRFQDNTNTDKNTEMYLHDTVNYMPIALHSDIPTKAVNDPWSIATNNLTHLSSTDLSEGARQVNLSSNKIEISKTYTVINDCNFKYITVLGSSDCVLFFNADYITGVDLMSGDIVDIQFQLIIL